MIAILVLAATPFLAAAPPPTDDEMRDTIEEQMAEEDLIDVKVSVKDRAVTLSGSVPNPAAAKRAMDRAQHAAEDADETAKVVSRLTVAETPADVALAETVAAELGGAVDVEARTGVVTLRGAADGEKAKALMERAAAVPGVLHVVNEMEKPVPASADDLLRERVAAAVLGGLARPASVAPRPSIQVTVEGGAVVLNGAVAGEKERARAEALARAVPGVSALDNRLRIER